MKYRVENDCIGSREVPYDAYYGIHGQRAEENFRITGRKITPSLIIAMAQVKKACAKTNYGAGLLDKNIAQAIIRACNRIEKGEFHDQFIVDAIQGGAGTSVNMNTNEVIANIVLEEAGHQKGNYSFCHPNDHVNMSQSTNDVYPTALKAALYKSGKNLVEELMLLSNAFKKKGVEFADILKLGRTQMMDAVPVTLGQEFEAYSVLVRRNAGKIDRVLEELLSVNLSGTAVGTAINVPEYYKNHIANNLSKATGLDFKLCDNLIDGTQNIDCFSTVSSAIKTCAVSISKIANDIRFMSSGPKGGIGEIRIPEKQNGSSIMPGKINPVIPEVVSQCAFAIAGNDLTVTMACEGGQMELNAFEPVVFDRISDSISILKNSAETFRVNCIDGIVADKKRCRQLLHESTALSTALCPVLGYYETVELANSILKNRASIMDTARKKGVSEEKLCEIFDINRLTGRNNSEMQETLTSAEHH